MAPPLPKPMASLGASLLGRRPEKRRVPLSFAPVEPEAADTNIPEVLRQIERLAEALGLETPEPQTAGATKRRACTVRLDDARHAQLRQIADARATSVQRVLVDALDHYLAHRPTGNQP